jgi:hypothetical protein
MHDGAVGHFDADIAIAQLHHLADDTHDDDFIAFLQRIDHLLVLLRLFHLGADHQEIKQAEHHDDREH